VIVADGLDWDYHSWETELTYLFMIFFGARDCHHAVKTNEPGMQKLFC